MHAIVIFTQPFLYSVVHFFFNNFWNSDDVDKGVFNTTNSISTVLAEDDILP